MELTINKGILQEVHSNALECQIEEYLNSVIDEELLQNDVNPDFIDQCIDALDSLYGGDYSPAIKLLLSEKSVLKYCKKSVSPKRKILQKAIVASLVIALGSSTIMYNTVPAFAEGVNEIFSQIISLLNLTADESEKNGKAGEISSIYATFPEDYSFKIDSPENIPLEDMRIFAVYQNNTLEEIPLSECTVNIEPCFSGDESQTMVVVAYDGCAFSVIFTVEE